jgi:PiT family inorganic phosphate transporter
MTISGGLFDDQLITASIILAGLVGAIVWNLMTWLFGLPPSSSHALFGGLIGAVIVGAGIASVNGFGVIVSKVLLPAIVAPLVAGIAAAWATRLAYGHAGGTRAIHRPVGVRAGPARGQGGWSPGSRPGAHCGSSTPVRGLPWKCSTC